MLSSRLGGSAPVRADTSAHVTRSAISSPTTPVVSTASARFLRSPADWLTLAIGASYGHDRPSDRVTSRVVASNLLAVATDQSEQRFSVPSHVLSRSVGEDTVLLDLHQDEYFSLSKVGARVWSLVMDGTGFEAIVDQIAESYAVDRAVVEADVRALVTDLLASGLLTEV